MARWHTIDLTNFDLAPAVRTTQQVTESITRRAVDLAKEATYVTVGFGVLAFQRTQVQRREFEKSLRS